MPENRWVAVKHLLRIEQEGAYTARLPLETESAGARRQISDYIGGVTRLRRRLDFWLGQYYTGKLEKMEAPLRQLLRLAMYELTETEHPHYAVLNEAVRVAKKHIRPSAGPLANGILRAFLRDLDHLPKPESGKKLHDLAVWHSHPDWLVRRWQKAFGEHLEDLLRWNNARPVHGLRINLLKTTPEAFDEAIQNAGIAIEAGQYLPYFRKTVHLQAVLVDGWIEKGVCAVQDEAAGWVVAVLDPQPNEVLVDACAAPGGKSTHAAMRMCQTGRIFAIDRHPQRTRLIQDAAKKQGISTIEALAADFEEWAATSDVLADRVLLDVPCSGTGVLSKRADARWQRAEKDLQDLLQRQEKLLDAATQTVKAGGLLVYSTCSIEYEENEAQVTAFLQRHPNFRREAIPDLPPELRNAQGAYQSLPFKNGMDGAYAVRLRKTAS
ncbi:MAG TPA: 16S rRNA (cytosine(967)-C(5))-methyltransferase RsmB, partial [Rhodothermales bacterium]|nr:16S rRNA (cytosine(967)-C(5))-methyltransferase RsmB [Rhodothermales bacterium]HRR09627.1 16S rRNA (cytosine(967)-C(5))-methyltransferase RsmB [Rhodothermales bacterium]